MILFGCLPVVSINERQQPLIDCISHCNTFLHVIALRIVCKEKVSKCRGRIHYTDHFLFFCAPFSCCLELFRGTNMPTRNQNVKNLQDKTVKAKMSQRKAEQKKANEKNVT